LCGGSVASRPPWGEPEVDAGAVDVADAPVAVAVVVVVGAAVVSTGEPVAPQPTANKVRAASTAVRRVCTQVRAEPWFIGSPRIGVPVRMLSPAPNCGDLAFCGCPLTVDIALAAGWAGVGRSPVEVDELVEHWTVLEDEQQLVAGKRGATRLGFALLLKFYTRSGRFPRGRSELPQEAVDFVARQMKVSAGDLGFYEVGRAQKTIFCACYLRLRDLQREIEEGLNVMESSNGANSVIAYGKGGEMASNRRDEQEMFVLCLRILQTALVYVNTLMLQDVLAEPAWADILTPADRRGLTPLFWMHLLPYGEVRLDMTTRLNRGAGGGA